jgi:hypothetical protein
MSPRESQAWCFWGLSSTTLEVSSIARLALRIGFGGPWRVWFWTTYWNSLFPARKPVDHEQAKAALAKNLWEPGRMEALQAMVGLSKADTASARFMPSLRAEPDPLCSTLQTSIRAVVLKRHLRLIELLVQTRGIPMRVREFGRDGKASLVSF